MTKNDKTLEEDTIEYVMAHPDFKKELDVVAKDIRNLSGSAPNEATLAANFELKLYNLMTHKLHVEFAPIKEESIDTARHIKKGRIDSRIGALVIEYKQKSKLSSENNKIKATDQLKNYLQSLPADYRHGAVGVVTDGWSIKFIGLHDDGFSETIFEDLSGAHLLRFIRGILSSDKKALTPANLITGFCSGDPSPAKELGLALYNALENKATARSKMLFTEWQAIFKLAHDDHSKQGSIQERQDSLADALNIHISIEDNDTQYKALYAIQTSYAIIVKAIAFKVLSSIRFNKVDNNFCDLAKGNNIVDPEIRTIV
jgi:hypothetical protein